MRPTYSPTTFLRAGIFTLGLLFAACGDDGDDAVSTDDPDSLTADDDDKDKPTKDASTNMCTTEGKSTACKCSSGKTGTQKCTGGKLGACQCGTGSSDGGKVVLQNKCKAGYYTGNFKGKYRPGAFGGGIFASGFEVDIEGGKSYFDQSIPPLAFSLTEELSNQGGEFATFTVGGGCMQGLATAVVITQSPFVARLEGELDCSTGAFTGTLTGYYTLIGIPGANFSFKGPLTADFNFEEATLDNGVWEVNEPDALDGNPQGGGNGTWNAAWSADMKPDNGLANPCDEIGPNGELPGTWSKTMPPSTTTDAGTP